MEPFESLGRALRARWAQLDFVEARFPELAVQALQEAKLEQHWNQRALVYALAREQVLPAQDEASFGQPPVSLYRDDALKIEALFWVDGTTSIHQHGFSGAFCVLEGGSVHARYRFERERALAEHLLLGKLALHDVEWLQPGQVRPIEAGTGFLHALFHLDRPTLSLVVRTHHAIATGPQYDYLRPGLAYDPFRAPESLMRRLDVLNMLLETEHPELRAFCELFVDGADAFALFLALRRINFSNSGRALVAELLRRARPRHAELVPMLEQALAHELDSSLLVGRRRALPDPELRFFLGVLLNVSGRQRVLELVAQRFPERNPIAAVLDWLQRMQQVRDDAGTGLGLELDPATLWILERLLQGQSEEQLIALAAREQPGLAAADIARVCFMLPFNSVLGPLLRDT